MELQKQISLFSEPHHAFSIKKHSSLVQMGWLWILDRKAINALILITKDQIKRNPDQKVFKIDLWIVKRLARYLSNNNKKLKNSLLKLQNESFEYNLFGKDKSSRWGSFSFLSHVDIHSKRGEKAILTYEFPSIVLDSIQDPNMYVMLNIFLSSDLSNHRHSGAFYELLKDYKGINKIILSIDRIKRFLWLEWKYESYWMFNKRVLKPVIGELNLKTELKIKYKPIMENGKFINILFTILSKDWDVIQNETSDYIKNRLKDFNLTEKQINTAIRVHDHDYLIGNIKVIEEEIKRRGNWIKSVPAMMMHALKVDYRPGKDDIFLDSVEQKKIEISKNSEKKALKNQIEKDVLENKEKLQSLIQQKMEALSSEQLEELKKTFILQIQKWKTNQLVQLSFVKHGFDHKIVQSSWNKFLEEKLIGTE